MMKQFLSLVFTICQSHMHIKQIINRFIRGSRLNFFAREKLQFHWAWSCKSFFSLNFLWCWNCFITQLHFLKLMLSTFRLCCIKSNKVFSCFDAILYLYCQTLRLEKVNHKCYLNHCLFKIQIFITNRMIFRWFNNGLYFSMKF